MPTIKTITDLRVGTGQSISLANKFDMEVDSGEYWKGSFDRSNDFLGFWDGTAGGGHFEYFGTQVPVGEWYWVRKSDLANMKFVGGSGAGTDQLYVIPAAHNIYSGWFFGDWKPFVADTVYSNYTGTLPKFVNSDWQGLPFQKIKYADVSLSDAYFGNIQNYASTLSTDAKGEIDFRVKSNSGVWKSGAETYVYIHGFNDTWVGPRSDVIVDALVNKYNSANVIAVDWSSLAGASRFGNILYQFVPWEESTVTKQVGESVASALIQGGADISKIHLIGHSLGSFVAASAAEHIKSVQGQKVSELVALDPAWAPGGYDIDARTPGVQKPLNFGGLAETTKSFTVSDLDYAIGLAGDNDLAATADKAYLIQYTQTPSEVPGLATTLAHIAVTGVYADLVARNNTDGYNAWSVDTYNRFNSKGEPVNGGVFDGVVAATLPWGAGGALPTYSDFSNYGKFNQPNSVGWVTDFKDPLVTASSSSDTIFFDGFGSASETDRTGFALAAGYGDDNIFLAKKYDAKGVDKVWGQDGADTYWFGYQRYGSVERPYLDKTDGWFGSNGRDSYVVIKDFDVTQDRLKFIWSQSELGYKDGAYIDKSLVDAYGDGIGILANEDLIAYLPGVNSEQALELFNNNMKVTYLTYGNLDPDGGGWLFR